MNNDILDTIYQLECALQEPQVRKSTQKLGELVFEDLREVTSSGNISSKADCLASLPAAPEIEFTMTEFSARQLSDDLVQTFFRTKKVVKGSNNPSYSRRSTIWKKEGGKWKMLYHQGTPTTQ